MNYYFYLKSVDKGSIENNVTLDVFNHWVNCNLYTQSRKTIQERLMVIFKVSQRISKIRKKTHVGMNIRNLLLHGETYLTLVGLRKRKKKNIWKVKMREDDL